MKNPVIVVRFSVVERDALTPEHVNTNELEGLHLLRMYSMQDVAQSGIPLGIRVAQEAEKLWESAILMGVLET